MTTTLNRDAYASLLRGDLDWLDRQPPSPERDHIRSVLLNASPPTIPASLLKRVSDDVERVIDHVERLQRAYRDAPDLDAAWDRLNGMRVYVNDTLEATDPPDQ